ncbi:hypothetical protein RSAG8_12631, partial [Rhizoctonia solani AG-8 WAC10335]
MNPPFRAGEVCVHSDDYRHSSSSNINSGQHIVAPCPPTHAPGSRLNSHENSDQHAQVSQASDSGSGSSTSAGAEQGPSSSTKICRECGKRFRRPGDLMDHMYKHTGFKRHHCPFCQERIAYSTNLTNHKKKCKVRTTSQK